MTARSRFEGRSADDRPNVRSCVERITSRPAYVRAMEIAGPAAVRPARAR